MIGAGSGAIDLEGGALAVLSDELREDTLS
jgi:hypothetical protein